MLNIFLLGIHESDMSQKYRSYLSLAKNLGSSKTGSTHWWRQRFSAFLLVIFTSWLMAFSWQITSLLYLSEGIKILQKPHNIVMILLFAITGLYHGMLGMQMIIEDYVHSRGKRLFLLVLMQTVVIVTIVSFIVSIITLMNFKIT